MQTSRFLLAIFMAGAGLVITSAQNPTPEDYSKMLEAVRQKVAEERANSSKPALRSSTAPRAVMTTPAPEKKAEPSPSSKSATGASESPELRQLLEDLRTAVARERAASISPPKTSAPSESSSTARPAVKAIPTAPVTVSTPEPAPTPPPAETQAGPATKQERLQALLLLYRADRLTPQEYHEQRAKLLAEQ